MRLCSASCRTAFVFTKRRYAHLRRLIQNFSKTFQKSLDFMCITHYNKAIKQRRAKKMSAVLYEIHVGEKVMIARSKKDAFRVAKDICEMEHKRAVVIATTLKTGREVRTVFE